MRLYDETATNAKTLLAEGVWQTWSFGPGIVEGGSVVAGIDEVEVDTNVGNHSIQGQQPRTGIGWVDTNHLLFIAVDGRSSGYSRGVTMTEMAQIFVDHGAQIAYNLDGGGSTAMIFNDALVNNPLGKGQERGTSDTVSYTHLDVYKRQDRTYGTHRTNRTSLRIRHSSFQRDPHPRPPTHTHTSSPFVCSPRK